MSPDDIDKLADKADPMLLWSQGLSKRDMPTEHYEQMMTGVLLRRHAAHLRALERCREEGTSYLITPIRPNVTAAKSVPTPEDHANLRAGR